ncbi:hypothetical protein Agub_g2150 [Astrephomene gubernaculifera]|uniref:CDP-diacylglycerol--glycerol-3-phosphate 3-phosphatidyltransferase n=1 Tax=Astrephomene gubernaculifera TaxID=47775 RepID=A0AAD3DIQ8_9CHLO|nr:hypothetical protein Agub_g2150 [Astrephomene gubernaculifera]
MASFGKVCTRLCTTTTHSHARALLRVPQQSCVSSLWQCHRQISSSRLTAHASQPKQHPTGASDDRQMSGSNTSTSQTPPSNNVLITIPTMLTIGRVAAIPVLIAAWYWSSPYSAAATTAIFAVASLTDWLDGYLARKMNAYSPFGAFLDPVADKLMVAAVLVLLASKPLAAGPLAGNDWLLPVCTLAIIGREITMSALREWAASAGPEARQAVAVNSWGKWKTASQMASLTLLLLVKDGGQGPLVDAAAGAGVGLLLLASWLTVQSLAIYMRGLWRFMAAASRGGSK